MKTSTPPPTPRFYALEKVYVWIDSPGIRDLLARPPCTSPSTKSTPAAFTLATTTPACPLTGSVNPTERRGKPAAGGQARFQQVKVRLRRPSKSANEEAVVPSVRTTNAPGSITREK